jgi:hypothetical protein
MFCILKRRIKHVFYNKKRGKKRNTDKCSDVLRTVSKASVGTSSPRNALFVLTGPLSSSSSSSSFHMTAKIPGKYVIPARFCIL